MKKDTEQSARGYADGSYWQKRTDMLYYQYIDYIVRTIASDARSMLDVGTGNCPYLEWFDWIPEKFSADIRIPYQSENVTPISADIVSTDLGRRFDLCSCLQVLEHVSEPERFARRLMELSSLVLVSVPHRWPENSTKGHLHDPVDLEKLVNWFGRAPNYRIVVKEPFGNRKNERLIAVFNEDTTRRYGVGDTKNRAPKSLAISQRTETYGGA